MALGDGIQPDTESLIAVCSCGCLAAWMAAGSEGKPDKHFVRHFYRDAADAGCEVKRVKGPFEFYCGGKVGGKPAFKPDCVGPMGPNAGRSKKKPKATATPEV